MTRLGFGRHRGCRLEEIPAGYLTWMLHGIPDLLPGLRAAVQAELGRRGGESEAVRFERETMADLGAATRPHRAG